MDRAVLTTVLDTLSQQLADFDTGAQDTLEANYKMLASGELASLTLSLERALESYDFDAAQLAMEKMRNTVTAKADESLAIDSERLTQVVEQLATLIGDYDTSAVELLEAEEELFEAAGYASDIKHLTKALEDYDFDSASEIIERLSGNSER